MGSDALIGMVAGEASGDLLGAHLVAALRERAPGLRFAGIGGPRMIGEGVESRFPMDTLSVRGYVEVARHYRRIMRVRRRLADEFRSRKPQLFIGVDAPDFNLGLERALKESGVRTIHYVSPSVWAWRGWRVRKMARSADRVLALFPFEPKIYREAGVPVTYVGHPLADMIPLETDKPLARSQLRLPPGGPLVALLPGSRRSELHYMADAFVLAAKRLLAERPDARFVCPLATRETRELFEAALERNDARGLPLTLLFGHSHEALAAADLALVASGTATLETALLRTPMVITYRMSPVTWAIMRRMLYLPYVGLPNILAGELIVPELLQEKATPAALAAALAGLLDDKDRCERQVARFAGFHRELRRDTAATAAQAVLEMLDGR
jgi:lipid-A-disaccharide synthase